VSVVVVDRLDGHDRRELQSGVDVEFDVATGRGRHRVEPPSAAQRAALDRDEMMSDGAQRRTGVRHRCRLPTTRHTKPNYISRESKTTRNVLWSRASVCVSVSVCPRPHAYSIARTRMQLGAVVGAAP